MTVATKAPCDEQLIATKDAHRAEPCPPNVGRWVLVATILASSMVFIDGSVVNVALPTLQRELNASGADVQWVVEAYALFLAALILVGGSLGDHLGRKRIFLIGTVLFAATSVWCGVAPNVELLITARAAQGIAGALLTPASLAIISATFGDAEERGRAIGTWSGFTAITAAFGPVLGGWLVDNATWRWVFFINIPLAAVVLAVAVRHVPESRDPEAGRLDPVGAILATVGLGALVFGLIESPLRGWGDPLVATGLVVGVVALAAFVLVEARLPSPMMPLGLFRARTFTGANLLTFFLYGAFGGALYYLPFNLVQVQGYSSTAAGGAFLPTILILFGLSRWTGGFVGRYGAKLPLVVGPSIVAVALLMFARPGTGGSYWTTFFPAAVVLGIGMAVMVPSLTTAVMSALPQRQAGLASGVNNAVSRTAGLLAIAVFGILVASAFDRGLDDRLDDLDLAPEVRTTIDDRRSDLAALDVSDQSLDPAAAAAVGEAVDESFVAGFRLAMIVGAVMAVLSAVAAWVLIEGKAGKESSEAQAATRPATGTAGGS